jgi:transcription antitermination factor NusG
VGDRVFASGASGDNGKSVTARVLIVVSQTDLTKKHERDRDEWRRRGIVGTIATLDAGKNELTVVARLPEGKKSLVVTPTANVKIRRYAEGSGKFNEARPSVLTEFKAGDQVRVLGNQNAEGTTFTAEEIVGGTFRVVPGVITAVNPANGEILVKDLQSQQALTIALNTATLLRRMPAELLARLTSGAASSGTAGQTQAASANTGGNLDVREALERQPPLPASDLKVGDMVIIISTSGADPVRLTAITFITGVDLLLQPLQTLAQTPAANRRPASLNLGLPEGLSSLGIGLP